MTTITENLKSWQNRCLATKSLQDCDKLEQSLDRLYDNNLITAKELTRMDEALFRRRLEIEQQN